MKKKQPEIQTITKNRRAFYDYFIEDKYEAGVVLCGSEVKSLREKTPSISEAYVTIENGEAWLIDAHIPEFQKTTIVFGHHPNRKRKLLLNRTEIQKIKKLLEQKGYTVVPLELYFNENNMVKLEIGIGKGKKNYDKREKLKSKYDD